MNICDIPRAHAWAEELKRLETAHDLLARDVVSVVSIPTGSFDGVTGRNYTSDISIGGTARVELRRVIKQEYERVAANLAALGVTVKGLS